MQKYMSSWNNHKITLQKGLHVDPYRSKLSSFDNQHDKQTLTNHKITFYFKYFYLLTDQVKVKQHVVDLQLQPLNIVLRKTLELLQTKDPGEIFAEPVDTDEVWTQNQETNK